MGYLKNIFSRHDRVLVREGALPVHVHKREDHVDDATHTSLPLGRLKYRPRYFFLFDDMLIQVRRQTRALLSVHSSLTYLIPKNVVVR